MVTRRKEKWLLEVFWRLVGGVGTPGQFNKILSPLLPHAPLLLWEMEKVTSEACIYSETSLDTNFKKLHFL